MRCKHGLDEEYCTYCNGFMKKQEQEIKEHSRNNPKSLFNKIQALQKESKVFATNNDEHYTDDEIKTLIILTENTKRTDVDVLFETAKILKRTYHAVDFMWKNLWDEPFRKYYTDKNFVNRVNRIKGEMYA